MLKIVLILTIAGIACTQELNRVRVINHREYMVEVISETIEELERREWCNLKLMDFTEHLDEDIISLHLNGTVLYTNGFVVSIQYIDVVQTAFRQLWSRADNDTMEVLLEAAIRLIDVTLGFDVEVKLVDGDHHYTGAITHSHFELVFSVVRNAHTHAMTASVTGDHPRSLSRMTFLPNDKISDVLTEMYDANNTFFGVVAWADTVFQPIVLDVITNKVPFPGLCYDCPNT